MADQPINDELLTIGTFPTFEEAEIAAALLDDHGIPAFIPDSHASAMMPHIFSTINKWGAKVQVLARDAEEAGKILEQAESSDPLAEEVLPEDASPNDLNSDQ